MNIPALVRERYKIWSRFLTKQVGFSLQHSQQHTKEHCARVLLFCLLFAQRENLSEQDADALAMAACFHDSRRINDGLDIGHGHRAAKYYCTWCAEHEYVLDARVVFIMAYHEQNDKLGEAALRREFSDDPNVKRLQALSQNPTIYAQLDGLVTALNYQAGDTDVDGKPLCIVGELDEITMTVPISASDIGSVSAGQKVNLYVDAYAEQTFTGTVTERLLVANDNGEYPVTISIDPGGQMLLPGMKAYATIILKEKTDVLTLSNKAITLENGRQYVLVRDKNGDLVQKQIVTGFSDGRVSEILNGRSEHEVVIVQE